MFQVLSDLWNKNSRIGDGAHAALGRKFIRQGLQRISSAIKPPSEPVTQEYNIKAAGKKYFI